MTRSVAVGSIEQQDDQSRKEITSPFNGFEEDNISFRLIFKVISLQYVSKGISDHVT